MSNPATPRAVAVIFALVSLLFLSAIVVSLLKPEPVISSSAAFDTQNFERPRWNWFSAPREVVRQEIPEDDENLAMASIRAELMGVLISGKGSYAAISTPGKPDGVYTLGDSIDNNVVLEAIEVNRVIISQRGSRRQIPLKSLINGNQRQTEQLIEVNETDSLSGSAFNLSGLVSTVPVSIAGGGVGLRLENLTEDLTSLADVQEGDVLISVNGTAISDMMSNPMLWQQFSRMTTMPVVVQRGEEEIELLINAAGLSEKILPQLGMGQVQ